MYGECSDFFRFKFLGCLAHREIWLQNVPLLYCYTLDVKFWPNIDNLGIRNPSQNLWPCNWVWINWQSYKITIEMWENLKSNLPVCTGWRKSIVDNMHIHFVSGYCYSLDNLQSCRNWGGWEGRPMGGGRATRHTGILSSYLVQTLKCPRGARGVKMTSRTQGSIPW